MITLKSKITPCLLLNGRAEDAAKFYCRIFKKSKIVRRNKVAVTFRLEGQDFIALNGPNVSANWAVSFYIACKTQKEVDYYWSRLSAGGGEEQPCGWVKDKFGFSWQVVPTDALKLFEHKNKAKADRAFQAMMKMKKLDLAKLKAAFDGR